MKITLKNLISFALTVIAVVCFAIPCAAAPDSGSITVTVEDAEKKRIDGQCVNLCCVAELTSMGYYPTKAFEHSGISISAIINNPNEMAAKTIADYIKNYNVDTFSAVSEKGIAEFSDLSLGIYLVMTDDSGDYTFNPYIVFIPYESEGTLHYEVSSSPKIEDNSLNETNIYVVKKWDDGNNASNKRPDSVTVELLNGEDVIEEVKLSESNAWAYTFYGLSKDGNYSVREQNVDGYKATYSGDAVNGFIVINTYAGEKLPQTGQLWWPVSILSVAGIGLVILGAIEVGAKKNDKKK